MLILQYLPENGNFPSRAFGTTNSCKAVLALNVQRSDRRQFDGRMVRTRGCICVDAKACADQKMTEDIDRTSLLNSAWLSRRFGFRCLTGASCGGRKYTPNFMEDRRGAPRENTSKTGC